LADPSDRSLPQPVKPPTPEEHDRHLLSVEGEMAQLQMGN